MQTFLPYENFIQTAKCLDVKRLGKQRVECLQILKTLTEGGGWENHPAVRMWAPYEPWLVLYGKAICLEWQQRGYKDTCMEKIHAIALEYDLAHANVLTPYPHFLGDETFHSSHRAALLLKDPKHYGQFGWTERPTIKYVWPLREER